MRDMSKNLKVLDLFSGIGGFSLGLERAGMETVAFCEADPHARAILKKHWPDVPIHDDVRTLDGKQYRGTVDLICGGFPCQDISVAGGQAGLDGERSGLWREYRRLVREIRPQWVIIENVSALRSNGLVSVLQDLWEIGYDAEWHCIPASAVGATHRRDRIWIVANPSREGWEERLIERQAVSVSDEKKITRLGHNSVHEWLSEWCGSRVVRNCDGIPHRVDRLRRLGNAVVPQIPEAIGRAILNVERAATECRTPRDLEGWKEISRLRHNEA